MRKNLVRNGNSQKRTHATKMKNRTKKACLDCGRTFLGSEDKLYCDECAKKRRSNVIRIRICKQCGKEFEGGPRAFYCPDCRIIRKREAEKRHRKNGTARPIGSIAKCEWCGAEYTVNSGKQKYCSEECQRKAVLEWQRIHKKGYNIESGQYDKKAEKRKNKIKVCVYCGRKFQSNKSTNLCSDYCKKKQHQLNIRIADDRRGRKANVNKLLEERERYRKQIEEVNTECEK